MVYISGEKIPLQVLYIGKGLHAVTFNSLELLRKPVFGLVFDVKAALLNLQ
jgi:hypothetical protein